MLLWPGDLPLGNSVNGEQVERRLAAVLATDVAGYGSLMRSDAEGTLARLKAVRQQVVDPILAAHGRRTLKLTGERMLVEFGSTLDAVHSALEVQRGMAGQNEGVPEDKRIALRIGINAGDIIFDDNDIFGDSVNIAARLASIADPGGIFLSDRVHREVADKVEIACNDMGPQALKNIARPVRAWRVRLGAEADGAREAGTTPVLSLPDKPSLAVLPFAQVAGDPSQDYFADGLVEDIITALSRFKWLFLIARNSSFTYKGADVDVKQVGRELGVRYVLQGGVQRSQARLRITARLVRAATAAQLWAGEFEGPIEDVFELQDKIAASVAGAIDPVMMDAEIERATERPTSDLTAYDLYMRTLPLFRAWAREPAAECMKLLHKAVARDPNYGPALSILALCHAQNFMSGWGEGPAIEIKLARELAERALAAAPNDPVTIGMAAGALTNIGEDAHVLKELADRAISRNPNSAFAWQWSGWAHAASGENDLAIEHFEMSLRLDPRAARKAFHFTGIGMCHFSQRRLPRAAQYLESAHAELPSYPLTHWVLAACYAQMGRVDEARAFAKSHGIAPEGPWLKMKALYHDPDGLEYLFRGLRMATEASA
jgi:adenylate cyclase